MLIKYFNLSGLCKHGNWFVRRRLASFFNNKETDDQNENCNDTLEDNYNYELLLNKYLNVATGHKVFIIHPYVKWGPKKRKVSNENQLKEAESLVSSLQAWEVVDKLIVPVENLEKNVLFGKGTLTKLTQKIRTNLFITSVFINVSTLKNIQIEELERKFGLPIYDRYNIVMQIFRLHATSKHAKLQVALAEMSYLENRLKRNDTDFIISSKLDKQNLMLDSHKKKLKEAMKKIEFQRELLRNKRSKNKFPVVAVIGYTNVGKTSLIKALTKDKSLIPKDQLFATLDVTFHAGLLPSTLKVLYIDTIGFLSDIPSGLMQCFRATLRDAMLADVILHVEDLSSPDFLHQRQHVISVLENLSEDVGYTWNDIRNKIVSVGNKLDVLDESNELSLKVSAKTEAGIGTLKHKIEEKVLDITERQILSISVPTGGNEMRWLYKNATILEAKEDKGNIQYNIMKVIITKANLNRFNHNFVT